MTEMPEGSAQAAGEMSRDEWLAEFAAHRWVLVNALGPDPHLERAKAVYESLKPFHPVAAAEMDLKEHPETRWQEDSGWSTAL